MNSNYIIITEINLYSSHESHYTRRDTSKRYLPSDLTLTYLHKDFCEKNSPVSIRVYTSVFKFLDLSFKKPKIDTCHKCHWFKAKKVIAATDEERRTIQEEHNIHLERADTAYKSKANDKEAALQTQELNVLRSICSSVCHPLIWLAMLHFISVSYIR